MSTFLIMQYHNPKPKSPTEGLLGDNQVSKNIDNERANFSMARSRGNWPEEITEKVSDVLYNTEMTLGISMQGQK